MKTWTLHHESRSYALNLRHTIARDGSLKVQARDKSAGVIGRIDAWQVSPAVESILLSHWISQRLQDQLLSLTPARIVRKSVQPSNGKIRLTTQEIATGTPGLSHVLDGVNRIAGLDPLSVSELRGVAKLCGAKLEKTG